MNMKKNNRNTLSREELNSLGKKQKRLRKHKGNPSGTKVNESNLTNKNKNQSTNNIADPRIGSKKPIVLTEQSPKVPKDIKVQSKALTYQEELEALESDIYLDKLLERIENNENLSDKEQQYIEQKLNRIDFLMQKLGIEISDDEAEEEKQEDIFNLLRQQ